MLRIALFTYSTKPRGGVVHTLALAEHLQALGHQVHVFALGNGGQTGFFRPVSVPFTLIPIEEKPDEEEALDRRIEGYIQTYYDFLARQRRLYFDVYHAQDCISANALWQLRELGLISWFVRTIHHTDDFISPTLINCQNRSIFRPDHRLVVSRYWQERLAREFGVDSRVIFNGVDLSRFRPGSAAARAEARANLGIEQDRLVFLNIGGIEPRKNTIRLLLAFETVRRQVSGDGLKPLLLLVGGETLLDYRAYRAEFFERLAQTGLAEVTDVRLHGIAPDEQIPLLYQAADALAFPSVKEGWGLVVLEAMASGLPVLASDLPVFREYLRPDEDALLPNPLSQHSIADGLLRLAQDADLRQRLAARGPAIARRFSWTAAARANLDFYQTVVSEHQSVPAKQ